MGWLRYSLIPVLAVFLLAGCATTGVGPVAPAGDTGSLVAQAQWPDDLSTALLTVRITASAPDMQDMTEYVEFSNAPGAIYGIHGIPVGDNRTVVLEGLDSNRTPLYTSSLDGITVRAAQITNCGVMPMGPVGDAAPAAPRVTDIETEDGKVTLGWEAVSGADSYNLYMNRDSGASKKNFDSRKTSSSNAYSWTNLDNDHTYHFVVTAENAHGESAASREVSGTPKAPREKVAAPKKKPAPAVKKPAPPKKKPAPPKKKPAPAVKKPSPPKKEPAAAVKKEVPVKKQEKKAAVPEKSVEPPKKEVTVVEERPAAPKVSATGALSLQEILRKVDEVRAPSSTFVFDMKLTSRVGDEESTNEVHTRVKDFRKSLVIYRKPSSQKGRVLLMVEDNMWIYFPGTRRPLKISPQQQLFGQVSNADVARVVYSLDYEPQSVEDGTIDGKQYLKMHLKAKSKGAAYGSIILWVEESGYKLYKADFFALSGRALKTIYYKKYEDILGAQRPTVQEIHDAIKKSEVSIMEYSNMKNDDTPDKYFQKSVMERVPQMYQ